MGLNEQTLYSNTGNSSVLQYIAETDRAILDIGCGAGDLGQAICSLYPSTQVVGITSSHVEYPIAQSKLNYCYLADVERDEIPSLPFEKFDAIIFSHVLEHLVDPVKVIKKTLPYLKMGGKVVIAVPNIANWRDRWKLALGKFEYTESGVMDKTHLRFYTFHTAPRYLIEPIKELNLNIHKVGGSVPLAFFRHYFLSEELKNGLDKLGCMKMPNLFGREIVMVALYDNVAL